MSKAHPPKAASFIFPKSLTGIQGLDDITTGGLPKNRPTLAASFAISVCQSNEPCLYCAFEEAPNQAYRRSVGY